MHQHHDKWFAKHSLFNVITFLSLFALSAHELERQSELSFTTLDPDVVTSAIKYGDFEGRFYSQ